MLSTVENVTDKIQRLLTAALLAFGVQYPFGVIFCPLIVNAGF